MYLLLPSSIKETDLVSVQDTAEIYGTMSENECKVSYVILHAPYLRYGRHIDNSASRSRLRLVWGSLTLAQYVQADNKIMSRQLSDDRPIYHCPRNVNFHQALPIPLDLQESAVGYT